MATLAEEFITSLGMESVPSRFWLDSMFEKPKDRREVNCESSAWDFLNGKDFRLKQCAKVNTQWLKTTQNRMGQIQYYLQYKDKPVVFRQAANPGFHEAIGDVMALSVATPSHLRSVGLLDKVENDKESDINFLMSQALHKLAFLPFGYMVDQWRWGVFNGSITSDNYNSAWWDLRCKLQGVSPPEIRSDQLDFDPGAKFHIPSNVPYIRYFVSNILQFQLHKSLCTTAGQGGSLYKCDIYRSKPAGRKLEKLLKLGASVEWPIALEQVTGTREMSAIPMFEYFGDLYEWLKKENEGHDIGWEEACPMGTNEKSEGKLKDETAARTWLRRSNKGLEKIAARGAVAYWDFFTNLTAENQMIADEADIEYSGYSEKLSEEADQYDWRNFKDPDLKRQFEAYAIANTAKLHPDKLKRLLQIGGNLTTIYSSAKVCERPGHPKNECFPLDPDLSGLMATSRDPEQLRWAWKGWREVTGPEMKDIYNEYIGLQNEAARIEEFPDQGEYWRWPYESDNFEEIVERLFNEVRPLYEQLHSYVRRKLMKAYPNEKFPASNHIPAHLLGNMWSQTWDNIAGLLLPYENASHINITEALHKKGYNITSMVVLADEFFQSLGLDPMTKEFWENSLFERPSDGRPVVCHASAWDMSNGTDFRIKQCTVVTGEWLETTHHEMGHIQYYMEYKHLPYAYRSGANPGFHEAIGDLIGLSATSPSYLKSVGLIDEIVDNYEADINYLLSQSLVKIAFLPFGYLIDQWRWSVFRGDIPKDNYNSAWWDLRCKYQGITPPFGRSDDEHFDPGAKYHIPGSVPYIRYFISFILQFQFHKSLCDTAGFEGPLHKCSIYDSKEAGQKLRDLLKLGSSVEWRIALEQVTGTREMSAKPMFEYFEQLHDWLKKENEGHDIGWEPVCPKGKNVQSEGKIKDEVAAASWLQHANKGLEKIAARGAVAYWDFYTNLTAENQMIADEVDIEYSGYSEKLSEEAGQYDWRNFKDPDLKRQFEAYAIANTAKLHPDKLKRLLQIGGNLTTIYSSAKVCERPGHPKNECFPLDPDLSGVMATSRDPEQLRWAWKGWREVTGPEMKDIYNEYIGLQNEAARIEEFSDQGEVWRWPYESDNFEEIVERLFNEVRPLYEQLHSYVRRKLMKAYPNEKFPASNHIPAHLLGNMWSQTWDNIAGLLLPYENASHINITEALHEKRYNITSMVVLADEFFQSLGLDPMTKEFWEHSLFERPSDGRPVVCHASAWDMSNGTDFRIKQCTVVTGEWLETTHHEMGHIQYYMEYKHLPYAYRSGANPGFHEAIGDLIGLSATSPSYLKSVGLIDEIVDNYEADINYLLSQSLVKVAFLPFGYLIDQWRWSVFRGDIPKDNYNSAWWDLRCKYQGITPPFGRSDDEHFDPGAKYHIPGNVPYIRYFISFILQFQFHKSLCDTAGFEGPLHKCSIYDSKEAGEKLRDLLKLGSSVEWRIALEQVTGTREMSAKPMFEYFEQLHDWLKKENEGHDIGWEPVCPRGKNVQRDGKSMDEVAARSWIQNVDIKTEMKLAHVYTAYWEFYTNLTTYNSEVKDNASLKYSSFLETVSNQTDRYDWRNFADKDLKRQFKAYSIVNTARLPEDKLKKLLQIGSELERIYSGAEVCDRPGHAKNECFPLEPDLGQIMAESRDGEELRWAWKGWREVTGPKMKSLYRENIELQNEAAKTEGFMDQGEYWREPYEAEDFEQQVQRLFEEVKPLYNQLHAYVKRKLSKVYPKEHFPASNHIPAHLLGNMWAQTWDNVLDLVLPYENAAYLNITGALVEKGYNVTRMVKLADEFFQSLGLGPMTDEFWANSLLEKPKDGTPVVCHASAWDMTNGSDYRIKQCTVITGEYLEVTHHEMGHIQYFMEYAHQPIAYRGGANPGFHEAIGDLIGLSASAPSYLKAVGIIDDVEDNREADINFLMGKSLEKIAFLPFGYLIDQWRWSVFRGDVTTDEYNSAWWDLRCKYQGIAPPYPRSDEQHFDPGAKYHIPANVPYIRYFVSFILQFQFHKSLCQTAGHQGPLYKCSIYGSKEAGEKLSNLLKLGSSVEWPEALEQVTGTREMSAKPMFEYFQDLYEWLQEENSGEKIGWEEACPKGTNLKTVTEPPTEPPVKSTGRKMPLSLVPLMMALLLMAIGL